MTNDMLEKLRQAMMGQSEQIQIPMAPEATPELIEEANNAAANAKANELAKSPNLMKPEEIAQKEAKQEAQKTPEHQLQKQLQASGLDSPVDRAVANKEPSMQEKLRANIARYEDLVNKPQEENNVMNWLTGIGKAANVVNRSYGRDIENVEYWGDTQAKAQAADKSNKLSQLQKLQEMYQKYSDNENKGGLTAYQKAQLNQSKLDRASKEKIANLKNENKSISESLSEGQKAVDKDYAKFYNTFSDTGMKNASNSIAKLEKLQKEVAADTGFGEAGGTRFPIHDMFRSRLAIERRDDARNFANKSLKELFGGQLSDAEREAAAREFWNDSLDNESNAKRLAGKIKELRDNLIMQKKKAKYYEKNNKSLAGYTGITDESSDEDEVVTVVSPDGEEVLMRRSKAKKYLDKGATIKE